MANILNALTLFGKKLPWDMPEALFWLLIAQVALIVFLVIVFAVLLHRVGQNKHTIIIEKPEDKEFLQAEVVDENEQEPEFEEEPVFEEEPEVEEPAPEPEPEPEPEEEVVVLPQVEEEHIVFPESLRGDWIVEGHENVRVIIDEQTAMIDGVEAHDVTLDPERPADYMMRANGIDYVLSYNSSEESMERKISGGLYDACNLVEYVELPAPEPEVEEPAPVEEPQEEPVQEPEAEQPAEQPAEEPAPEQPAEEPTSDVIVAPVVVVEQKKPETVVVEEESFEGGTLRYDRSFTARIIQADDDQKSWYTEIKNEIMSYKKVHSRISWKKEGFNIGRNVVARIAFRGLTLCLYLPLNADDYADSKYKVEPIEDNASFEDTPCLYRIKNAKRARYAKELLADVLAKLGAEKEDSKEAVDYYLPYEGTVQLINKGLIKRVIRSKKEEAIFNNEEQPEGQPAEQTGEEQQ